MEMERNVCLQAFFVMFLILCADTGGSCRVPASLNGVAGLRPTKGCYANDDGIVPLSSTRDTPGTKPLTPTSS